MYNILAKGEQFINGQRGLPLRFLRFTFPGERFGPAIRLAYSLFWSGTNRYRS